jgi:hypothetical protein
LASSDQIAKPRAKAVIVNAARAQRRNRQVNSIAGMQVSNLIFAIVAVVVLWMIYSAFIH